MTEIFDVPLTDDEWADESTEDELSCDKGDDDDE